MRPLLLGLSFAVWAMPLAAQSPLLDSIQMLGGSGFDTVVSITPDQAGSLFVLGTTQSPDFPATTTFGTNSAASTNPANTFVAKINLADWSLAWSVVIQPSMPLSLALDGSGAVYITGHTDSPSNFPATPGAFVNPAAASGSALFVVKLDPTGSQILYSALLAPYALYTGAPIAVDSQGQAYVAASGAGPVTPGAFISAVRVGSSGAYLAKLSADGSKIVFCTYLATSATVAPAAVAVDGQQAVFVAGSDSEYNSSFPVTSGVVQTTHGGGDDAFVMKLQPDGTAAEFATLLGGAGGDRATAVQLGADGTIYLAGHCEYGTESSATAPFPLTPNAPFSTFGLFNGFVARLSADASTLLFSSYISNSMNSGVAGFAIAGGQVYAAYEAAISQGFPGLNYYPQVQIPSTAVQIFDQSSGAAVSTLQIPALPPEGFAVTGTNLVVAAHASQINRPVPWTIASIGPASFDSTKSIQSQSHITLGSFLLGGTPDHDLESDRGYLYFESYPGSSLQQTLNLNSAAGAVPFQLFSPLTGTYTISPQDGITPAAVSVSSAGGADATPPAFLLVSRLASPSIQLLPVVSYSLPTRVTAQTSILTLPASGGPGTATIQLTGSATSPLTQITYAVPVPYQFSFIPSFLTFTPSQGTTPAAVSVTGQLDSLPAGKFDVELVMLVSPGQSQTLLIELQRPGAEPLVSPVSFRLNAALGQQAPTATLSVTPPDSVTAFQVLSVPPGITVSPASGTGPATLTVTPDPTQFSFGTHTLTFTVQVGTAQVPVSVILTYYKLSLAISTSAFNIAPGERITVSALGVAANLPATGTWADTSPAPTDWNGYTFVYRGRTLPILSANASRLAFDVQFPYDLDLTAQGQPIAFVAPDGTVLSSAITYGKETATAIGLFSSGAGYGAALKADGSVVSSTNPVSPGDTVRVLLTGAGATNPAIAVGLLPDPSVTVAPIANIQAAIGGKPCTIVQQALDSGFIGVTDLDIQVPNVASGLELLGLQSGTDRIDLIQIWIAN